MRFSRRLFALMLVLVIVLGNMAVAVGAAKRDGPDAYTLTEETVISEDEAPLAASPMEEDCCILHFVLLLCALAVTCYYTYDRKKRQEREFELRSMLR